MAEEKTTTERPSAAERPFGESGAAALGRGGRMSRSRKMAAVLRLLRGEDLETVSRGLGVTAATLSQWREAFLAAGEAALMSRSESGEALENERLKARLGQVLIERDLLEEKIALLETKRPLDRRRQRPITTKYAGDIAYLTAAFLRQDAGPFRLHSALERTPWFI